MGFRCDHCGHRSGKWMGFCAQCGAQEPLIEETEPRTRLRRPAPTPVPLGEVGQTRIDRASVGIGEFDRVLGGGLVDGAAILLGGEPGVGKSTLLLQVAGALARPDGPVLIATAEESTHQVGLRAERLGLPGEGIELLASDDLDAIVAAADRSRPALLVIDSIQTVATADGGGAPGGVSQVRESAARAIRFAKSSGVPVILIGHVTKDGGIAGPKLLEHMVDVVLSLEGDPDHGLRTLRSMKNRFGATHVAGLFEMRQEGLVEVADPSAALIEGWRGSVPGSVVFPTVEGRRPVLVEVQALVANSPHPQPRRSFRGVEAARVHQLLAVLDRHTKLGVMGLEVYVNVVGGMRVVEPAADLPIALAVASSAMSRPLGPMAAWGEVGLTGELRSVPMGKRRREEAERLGIGQVIAADGGTGPEHLVDALLKSGLVAG